MENILMIAVTLQEAKAKLNQLVEAARAGQQVVLLRGSLVVATLHPLTDGDLEIAPRLTDVQAGHFWDEVGEKKLRVFTDPRKAVAHLKRRRR